MKKLWAIVLAVVLCLAATFTLVGCKPDDGGTKFTADVFYYTYDDAYISTVRDAMKKRFDALGAKYTFYNGEGDQAKQTGQIDTALERGTNLLVVNLVNTGSADAARSILEKAQKKNIPVIFFNREPADEVFTSTVAATQTWLKQNAAFVGTAYKEAGYLEGQAAAEYLLKAANIVGGKSKFDKNADNKLNYVMLRGEMDNNEARARTIYSVLTANYLLQKAGVAFRLQPSTANANSDTAAYPAGWRFNYDGQDLELNAVPGTMAEFSPYNKYSVDSESKWSAKNATAMLDTAFGTGAPLTNGTIEFIFANNDDMAIGAVTSLNKLNYNLKSDATGYDAAKYIPLFGVDATDIAKAAIKDGKMTGTILQSNIAMANTVITLLSNVAGGGKLMDGTFMFNVDATVNKLRIPYDIVR